VETNCSGLDVQAATSIDKNSNGGRHSEVADGSDADWWSSRDADAWWPKNSQKSDDGWQDSSWSGGGRKGAKWASNDDWEDSSSSDWKRAPKQQHQQQEQRQQQSKGQHNGGAGAITDDLSFSGTVISLPPAGQLTVSVECHEAGTVHGNSEIAVPLSDIPGSVTVGLVLGFALRADGDGGSPKIAPGTVSPLANVAVAAGARLVGTLKAFTRRSGCGDRVGWLTCAATQQTFNADVYVHDSLLQGVGIGDALAFQVHTNARGQPQASIGSVCRLAGPRAPGPERDVSNLGMDSAAYAPGRLVFPHAEATELPPPMDVGVEINAHAPPENVHAPPESQQVNLESTRAAALAALDKIEKEAKDAQVAESFVYQ
jgi:hypothetical protein